MTDEFDRLRAALQDTPAPDADMKAAHLRAAMENFDTLQETADPARPSTDAPKNRAGFWNGVSKMLGNLTSRGALAASTGLIAAGLALFVILPNAPGVLTPPSVAPPAPGLATDDDVATSGVVAQKTPVVRNESAELMAEPMIEPVMEEPLLDAEIAMEAAPMDRDLSIGQVTGQAQAVAPQMLRRQAAPLGVTSGAAPARSKSVVVPAPPQAEVQPNRLLLPQAETETFANEAPNSLKVTIEEPVSTFSIDVDTASYSVVRQSIMSGRLPPKEAVRVEEMVNYFPYDYAAPDAGEAPFRTTVQTFQTPWNEGTQLVHIGLQGQLPAVEDRPPLNLVFLIDTSGSMQNANKLPLLKQSLRLMLSELRPEDQVAIVTYAGSAGQVLAPTPASDQAKILNALDQLEAGGSTAGQAGLQQAYAVAEGMAEDGEVSRILLATDGDFNVGLSDPEALKDFIADKRDTGTYLSVLGFGRGNLDDATMQALAQNGNGQAAYIDTLAEARKVLVDQLTGALFPIANDVKIQVEFNPATVAEYRLIGYETRALRREDFNNDKVDAGEIGAGHSVTAIYEITPVGSPAVLNDPLRYAVSEKGGPADELGFLRLRYKEPGVTESQLIETPIGSTLTGADQDARFAAAIAGFGQLLRDDSLLGDWGFVDAATLAAEAKGDDPFGYRSEAVTLMRLADSLSR
ncbi:vWA domain-containing protein [Actibacterium pelagium]|uniref:VWFA domain-containing protein n=1 Tax=Actibacterium pelagium TaxID=2029103 RepID=A0A917AHD9_9RHOB|nr:VWA domain-containing protein [Actibacterium pelagium]GGE53053.1 hypothetical protein GCM10011517_21080 [Actibacterium pelagium]